MLSEIESVAVEEFIVGSAKPTCPHVPPSEYRTHHRFPPEIPISCQKEPGHEEPTHFSNPYYNLVDARNESYVWGIDDKDGYSFAYTIDLDALEKQEEKTYTLSELLADLAESTP